MDTKCKACSILCVQTGYGSMVCPWCGREDFRTIYDSHNAYCAYSVPLVPPATYTRMKRFRKYLQRAARQQSTSTVPPGTWDYLFAGKPYSCPGAILRRLKRAPKHICKKCYDSLPYLTAALCPQITVPCINENEKEQALQMFTRIDCAIRSGPFVSYLYCLEYILKRLHRSDICEHINCIQCPKRRATYKFRLDKIFGADGHETIEDILRSSAVHPPESLELQVPGDPTLTPDSFTGLQEALLPGHVAGSGDVPNARRLR